MEKKRKHVTRKYLRVEFRAVNVQEKKRSKPAPGRLYHVHKTGFWMDVPSVEIEGMHLSFGSSTFVRNSLELEIQTTHPIDKIKIKGDVEWYELITGGGDFKFNVGVSIMDISNEDQKKFNALLAFYKENMEVG